MTTELFYAGILQGLILTIVTYGIMIPFRLLNFQDLSSEGSYPLGASLSSFALLCGISPLVSIFFGSIISGFVGILVALISLRLKINSLLAGIIVSSMIYTINLRILGQPNVSLFNLNLLFSHQNIIYNIICLACCVLLLILPVILFLKTEHGLQFRASGLNTQLAKRYSISITKYTLLGLFYSSFLNGFAGSIIVQIQNYTDIYMGSGIAIQGLAALMVGESIIGTKTLNHQLLAPLVGALIYQQLQGFSMCFGLAPSDLKFFTAIFVLILIGGRTRMILFPR